MRPVLQALVLAERIYTDAASGKKIIAGTFNRINIKRRKKTTPDPTKVRQIHGGTSPGSPSAYISLTDVCPGTKIRLQFVSLTRNFVIFETEITIDCDDRLATVELVADLPELRIKESGIYTFEIVSEGEVLGSHRLTAEVTEETDQPEE